MPLRFRFVVMLALTSACTDPRVRGIAAKEMGCPEERVSVGASHQGDASESYEVSGCGKRGTLHCNAPDFACFFVPAP
jgi:hypothetical protein